MKRLDEGIAAVAETKPEPRRFARRSAGLFRLPVEPPFGRGFVQFAIRCPAAFAGAGNRAAQRALTRDLATGSIAQGI